MPDDEAKPFQRGRREPDFELLDAARLRLFEDGSGWLRLTLDGDRTYLGVKVVRAFPHSDPDHYLGLLDARDKDQVIGLVVDPAQLDDGSRRRDFQNRLPVIITG